MTSSPAPTPETSTVTASSSPFDAGTVPVACDAQIEGDPERKALIESFLVESGPYSGDSFDVEAAARAAVDLGPVTAEEWAQAIRAQVQGDYADAVCRAMQFSSDITAESGSATAAPEPQEDAAVGQNHFALVLDASGSMAAEAATGTAMQEAKGAIEDFVAELPAGSTVSLRIYGHGGTNTSEGKAESCASSEQVYTGDPDDPAFTDALAGVEPVGYTPLALAINDAQEDIPPAATDAIMYVVSDGLETCGGDPVQAATDVAATGINPVINVIGFRVADSDQDALRAIATAGVARSRLPTPALS